MRSVPTLGDNADLMSGATFNVLLVALQLTTQNADRYGVMIGNNSAVDAFIWFDNTVTATKGLKVGATNVQPLLLYRDWFGPFVSGNIWAISTGAGTNLSVIELKKTPGTE